MLKLGIYVNKNLRMANIQVCGFDYDYTLAHYSANLQTLIYDLAKEHMVNEVSFFSTDFYFTLLFFFYRLNIFIFFLLVALAASISSMLLGI